MAPPKRSLRTGRHHEDPEVAAAFERLCEELEVPRPHSAEAVADAADATDMRESRRDRTDIELVTIDPPHSLDLDQAYHAERRGGGYTVHYAIADVGAFVRPGSALDHEVWERGVSFYLPDRTVALHPKVLSEGTASLLPGVDRAALLWTLTLDEEGELERAVLEPSLVRSREKLSYAVAQERISSGSAEPSLALLREIGELRLALEQRRGGIHLPLPSQEIVSTDGRYDLVYDRSMPVEEWNAQISLLTGIAAAGLASETGVGILRTLPPADPSTISDLRRTASVLGIHWPDGVDYPAFIRSLDPENSKHLAMTVQARTVFRGADYRTFVDGVPDDAVHAAIAAQYCHVTAPLRRLCDRVMNEILVAHCADRSPEPWSLEAAERIPDAMRRARSHEGRVDRAVVDLVEAVLLGCRTGDTIDATVISEAGRDRVGVHLDDPAIVSTAEGRAASGDRAVVRVDGASLAKRRVQLSLVT